MSKNHINENNRKNEKTNKDLDLENNIDRSSKAEEAVSEGKADFAQSNGTVTSVDVDALSESEAKKLLFEALSKSQLAAKTVEQLTAELTDARSESLSNKDKWYRTAAEFENFKKRNQETRRAAYFDGKKDVILSILVIGDSIDRALALEMDEKTKEGIDLIARQFGDTLSALGVKAYCPVGEAFDPNTCEAIAAVPCEDGEAPGIIKTVFKKGYFLEEKLIRYCQVIVTK